MDTEKFTRQQVVEAFGSNKYLLVNVSAQRARMINDGVEVYVKACSTNPLEVAFQEIEKGHISFQLGTKPVEVEEEVIDDEILALDEMMSLESELDFADDGDEDFDIESLDMDDSEEEALDEDSGMESGDDSIESDSIDIDE